MAKIKIIEIISLILGGPVFIHREVEYILDTPYFIAPIAPLTVPIGYPSGFI